jgi:hypothetical protein
MRERQARRGHGPLGDHRRSWLTLRAQTTSKAVSKGSQSHGIFPSGAVTTWRAYCSLPPPATVTSARTADMEPAVPLGTAPRHGGGSEEPRTLDN